MITFQDGNEKFLGLKSALENEIFNGKQLFFKNFDFNKKCRNEIEDKYEKIRLILNNLAIVD